MNTNATNDSTDDRLLSVRAAARLLGVGKTKLYQLVQRGCLPVVYIDRLTRIPSAAVAAFVIAHTSPALGGAGRRAE